MKKTIIYLIGIIITFTGICSFSYSLTLEPIKKKVNILNNDEDNVVDSLENCDDPIKCGQYGVAKNINIVSSENEIESSGEAQNKTVAFVKRLIDYFLTLLGLLALLYLLYSGFQIVTAGGNEEKHKNGIKGLKYAAIAIIGVGLSLVFIQFIFRVLFTYSGI